MGSKKIILTAEGKHYNEYVEGNVYEKFTLWDIDGNIYLQNRAIGGMEIDSDTARKLCSKRKWNTILKDYSIDYIIEHIFINGTERLLNTEWNFIEYFKK